MAGGARRYRTKIEVLRDFLEATDQESRKSRIIGIANLNRVLFRRYLALATSFDLVMVGSGGYQLTPRARPALEAIDRYLARRTEAVTALQDLRRVCHEGRGGTASRGAPTSPDILRVLVHPGWTEVRRATDGGDPAPVVHRPGGSRLPRPPTSRPAWWLGSDGDDEPTDDLEGTDGGARRARPRALHRTVPPPEPKRRPA